MNCRECEAVIFESSAPTLLSTELKSRFERHLTSCSQCRQLFMLYAEGMENLSAGRRTERDPLLYDKIEMQMQAPESKQIIPRKIVRLGTTLSGVAAAVILGIFIGNSLINPLRESAVNHQNNIQTSVVYAQDDLYQEDAFMLALESYLSESENVSK